MFETQSPEDQHREIIVEQRDKSGSVKWDAGRSTAIFLTLSLAW
jgi:hypothetical protein